MLHSLHGRSSRAALNPKPAALHLIPAPEREEPQILENNRRASKSFLCELGWALRLGRLELLREAP
jgi:hypothetical protein